MHDEPLRLPQQEELLQHSLRTLLGDADAALLARIGERVHWRSLSAGEVLMAQGEPGDAMFVTLSGRLRVTLRDAEGSERVLREVGRGEVLGEMSLITDEPRSATVTAMRDTLLAQLDKRSFHELLAASPELSLALTRQIVRRLQSADGPRGDARPVTVALAPVSAGVDPGAFAAALAAAIAAQPQRNRVAVLDAAAVARALGGAADDPRRVALLLDEMEARSDLVLLVADAGPTPWTALCLRHGDEILLLADAAQPPAVHAIESELLGGAAGSGRAGEVLVLLHAADAAQPRGTRAWLDRRPVADHVHVRRGHAGDMARLGRLQTRTAVGLVLAGGGARGFAHLGVWRALQEAGVPVDVVGGTSMGAVMGVLMAADRPLDQALDVARRAFALNPTGDFNPFPLISLIRGGRLRRVVDTAIRELTGFDARGEDLWKGFFCVATNYSRAREEVLRRGPLLESLLASVAIPGALPPVIHDGDLLCDGGTFNNFPVDVMQRTRGVGRIVGVDLGSMQPRRIELERTPGPWALLRDRLRPRRARRYRLPSLASYLLNVSILYSNSRRGEARRIADLVFEPPLHRVGMLDWSSIDRVAEQGYRHAREVLAAQPAAGTH